MSTLTDFNDTGHVRLKIVLLGDRAVGKSSIIQRFTTSQFNESIRSTIGVDFTAKRVKCNKTNYKIELWDTAGQEKYRSLVKSYLKGAEACLFVYDSHDITSYKNLVEWIKTYDSIATQDSYKLIIANKIDISPTNPYLQLQKATLKKQHEELRIREISTSAKTGHNIQYIFEEIIQQFEAGKIKKSEKLINMKSLTNVNFSNRFGLSCCPM